MIKPYSFKSFWLSFIILNLIIFVMVTLTQNLDLAYGILLIGIFYFYNRGYKTAQNQHKYEDKTNKGEWEK